MSYCRARLVAAPRLGVEKLVMELNPLYRGTDLRHRTIRKKEFVTDDRTDETSGRDEKDVGVHSCNCGVAEKSAARWLTCIAVQTHAKTGTLFCMEWRAARLRWCKNGTTRFRVCPAINRSEWYGSAATSQGGPDILTRSGIHKTKAGSFKLSQLAAG